MHFLRTPHSKRSSSNRRGIHCIRSGVLRNREIYHHIPDLVTAQIIRDHLPRSPISKQIYRTRPSGFGTSYSYQKQGRDKHGVFSNTEGLADFKSTAYEKPGR